MSLKDWRVEYDYVGGVSEEDANELIEFAELLREDVLNCLKKRHPEYVDEVNHGKTKLS